MWRRFPDHNRTTVGIYDLRLLQAKPPASSPEALPAAGGCTDCSTLNVPPISLSNVPGISE